jgi:hypothetical protein
MLLNEILKDRDIPTVHWMNMGPAHMGMFAVNRNQYAIQMIKVEEGNPIHEAIPDQALTDNTFFFSFAAIVNGMPVDTDTGKHEALAVFSTIMQTLVKFVYDNKVDTLYFGCATDHAKLKSLYQRIITRYSNEHNWQTVATTTVNYMGGNKFVWVVAKQ